VLATRRQGWRGFVGRANGGMIVHLGVIILAVGIIASNANVESREFRLEVGESAVIEGHTLLLVDVYEEELPRKLRTVARIQVDGGEIHEPAMNLFRTSGRAVPTPSVRTTWTNDIALSIFPVESLDDPVGIRAVYQPLIAWLWTGGALMVLGTVLAAFPGQRRRPTDPVSAPMPDERAVAAP
jgi:cytochrome c-type biogenesis protein CcmF